MMAMFIDCPYCGFLVATDDEGRPLPRCPNCAQRLREDGEDATATPVETAPQTGEGLSQVQAPTATPTPAHPEAATATGIARAAGADNDRERLVEAPAGAADTQAVHDDHADVAATAQPQAAPDTAQPSGATTVAVGIATPAPAHRDPESMPAATDADDTATREVAATVAATQTHPALAATSGAAAGDVTAAPDASTAEVGADADAIANLVQRETPVEAEPEAPAATDPPATTADVVIVPDPSTAEAEAENGHATTAASVADADVIAELMQRDTPVEAEIEAPAAAGAPATAMDAATAASGGGVAADTPPGIAEPPPSPASATPARKPTQRRATPSFVRTAQAPAPVDRRRLLLRCSAIAVLSLLLALQLMLSERTRLAADAGWRPLLASLCGLLQCSLPPWREPTAFELLERDVRAHPSLPGVLRVSARFRNDARWPQPWPAMQLTLSDVNGRSVATRVFRPREYLGGSPTQSELGSGQAAAVALDVIEPGTQAVAFTFDFQ